MTTTVEEALSVVMKARKEIVRLKALVKAQEEYIDILIEDLDSAANSASITGWESTLIEDGIKAWAKIVSLKDTKNLKDYELSDKRLGKRVRKEKL